MRPALALLLAASAVLASPEDEAGIRKLFETLSYAARNGGGPALAPHFDFRTIRASLRETGMEGQELDSALAGFRRGLEKSIAGFGFERTRVRKVAVAADRKKATAVVDHLQNGVWFRLRWSIVRRGEGWALVDFDNLETGLRYSTTITAAVGAILANGKGDFQRYQRAEKLLESGNQQEALALYSALDSSSLPQALKAICRMQAARAHFELGNHERALEGCDAAARLGDIPSLDFMRALAHNALGNPEAAVACAQRYIEAVGPDADAYAEIGEAYSRLGKPEEATAAYLAGLAERPEDVQLIVSLALALPDDRKAEAAARFRALPNATKWMEMIGEACIDGSDWAALAAFSAAFVELAPGSNDAIYYDARLRARRGEHGEAALRLLGAIPHLEDPEERKAFVYWYLRSASEAGSPLDGYKALPVADRTQAFYQFAEQFSDEKNAVLLDDLIQLRARDAADPAELFVWQAELLWLRGRYTDVAAFVTQKIADIRRADADRVWLAEDRWVHSLHRLKRHDEALRVAVKCEDPDLALLAHAALDDVDAAIAAFARCVDEGWAPQVLYDDEDIGPLLKTEKFAPLRAKYPPGE